MTATIGIAHSAASRDEWGTFQVDTRRNFGDEFPVKIRPWCFCHLSGSSSQVIEVDAPWSMAT